MADESLEQKVGAKLVALRSKKKLTQPELAKASGVSARAIWSYENGKQLPSVRNLEKLATFFGVTASSVLK